jgi:hypothetical protein
MATEAARLDGKKIHIRKNKTVLTHTGLLMEGTRVIAAPKIGIYCRQSYCWRVFGPDLNFMNQPGLEPLAADATKQPSPPTWSWPFPGSAFPGHSVGLPIRLGIFCRVAAFQAPET